MVTAALPAVADPERIARDVVALATAGVGWTTVRHLAVAVRLAGIRSVLALGARVVEGPDAGVDAVRAVLEGLARHPRPHVPLERTANLLRLVSVERPGGAS